MTKAHLRKNNCAAFFCSFVLNGLCSCSYKIHDCLARIFSTFCKSEIKYDHHSFPNIPFNEDLSDLGLNFG